jgi:hypothetical protein
MKYIINFFENMAYYVNMYLQWSNNPKRVLMTVDQCEPSEMVGNQWK